MREKLQKNANQMCNNLSRTRVFQLYVGMSMFFRTYPYGMLDNN